jgi:PAS domain S-box-containing protein
MTEQGPPSRREPDEQTLLADQSLRYAQDIVRVYEEEKARRRDLEQSNQQLHKEIAERQRAEEALRQSEERFRAIFETAQDCIYVKDKALNYTHANPAMLALFNLSPSQIIGSTDQDLHGREASLRLKETDRRVLAGEPVEREYTRTIQGVPLTFLETKVPLRDSSGAIVGLCGIMRNVTGRTRRDPIADKGIPDYPSRAMKEVMVRARLAASQESIVLLLGESGSGKDYLARIIHDASERSRGPFFSINCASVAPELAESELFGHEAGAFTGARVRKRGLLELAEGGTLFLNEIGELSLALQAKLLTFLDTRSFTRVGGEKNISVDARLIAATNRDLEAEVAEGRFRRDLYYRLNVLALDIPALRERREDIPLLVGQILAALRGEIRLVAPPSVSGETMESLKAYDWPGNIRELRNVLERALILSGGGVLLPGHLGLADSEKAWTFATDFPDTSSLNDVTKELKRALIREALRRSKGNKVAAAKLLKISRNSLNHYMASLGMSD